MLSKEVIARINIISAHRIGHTLSEISNFFRYSERTVRRNVKLFEDWIEEGNDPEKFSYKRHSQPKLRCAEGEGQNGEGVEDNDAPSPLREEASETDEPDNFVPTIVDNVHKPLEESKWAPITFKCELCPKAFKTKISLEVHNRNHTGERPFECEHCPKTFTQKSNLVKHTLTHTGDKPYQCEICLKTYRESGHLARHKRTHGGEKRFQCDICAKGFIEKWDLVKHKLTHTGEKRFKCEICFKQFTQRQHLNFHLAIHSGEKPFQCELCQKRFRDKRNFFQHKLTHREDQTFECEVCQKTYLSKRSLVNHQQAHRRRFARENGGTGLVNESLNEKEICEGIEEDDSQKEEAVEVYVKKEDLQENNLEAVSATVDQSPMVQSNASDAHNRDQGSSNKSSGMEDSAPKVEDMEIKHEPLDSF